MLCSFFAQGQNGFCIKGAVYSKVSHLQVNASIVLINNATGEEKESNFGSEGKFYFKKLQAGTYTLKVQTGSNDHSEDTILVIKKHSLKKLKIYNDVQCFWRSAAIADSEILKGHPQLLIPGKVIVHGQDLFEKKYGVKYEIYGCIAPDQDDCMISYNKVVFAYLDGKFGKAWRKEIRKDVVGFE